VRLDPVVVVHGGGRAVSALSRRLGLPVEKRDGRRVTSPEVAEVVELVMGGPVNRQVVTALRAAGLDAVGVVGRRRWIAHRPADPGELGHVGEIAQVRVALLESFLLAGLTPVIAPMAPEASGAEGTPLNVNAGRRGGGGRRCAPGGRAAVRVRRAGRGGGRAIRPALEAGDVETLVELGTATMAWRPSSARRAPRSVPGRAPSASATCIS